MKVFVILFCFLIGFACVDSQRVEIGDDDLGSRANAARKASSPNSDEGPNEEDQRNNRRRSGPVYSPVKSVGESSEEVEAASENPSQPDPVNAVKPVTSKVEKSGQTVQSDLWSIMKSSHQLSSEQKSLITLFRTFYVSSGISENAIGSFARLNKKREMSFSLFYKQEEIKAMSGKQDNLRLLVASWARRTISEIEKSLHFLEKKDAWTSYMYCEETQLSPETAGCLMNAAKKYLFPKLVADSCSCLLENLRVDVVIKSLDLSLQLNEPRLETTCLKLILANANDILTGTEILSASRLVIEAILESGTMSVKETVMFEAAVRWVNTNCRGLDQSRVRVMKTVDLELRNTKKSETKPLVYIFD